MAERTPPIRRSSTRVAERAEEMARHLPGIEEVANAVLEATSIAPLTFDFGVVKPESFAGIRRYEVFFPEQDARDGWI